MADDTTVQNTQEVQDNTTAVKLHTEAVSVDTQAQTQNAQAVDNTSKAHKSLSDFISSSSDQLKQLGEYLDKTGIKLEETTKLSEGQKAAFGAISVAVLGAGKAYDSLNNIDTRGLSDFSKQIDAMGDSIKNSPLYQTGLMKAFSLGKTGDEAAAMATSFVKNMAASAAQVTKLENAMLQLNARTGTFAELQQAAGPNWNNVNALAEQQNTIIQQTANVFQLSSARVADFYTELGSVQGAINTTIPATGAMGGSVSGLTAAMLLAKGTGREFSAVVNDMRAAFENYNLKGAPALDFTARMTEISQKFNIPLEAVDKSLLSVANNFGIFGNQADGAARLYNNYLGALEKTGISGPQAIGVVQGMTESVKGLSIAQKAFLSAQTGGPGGLLGGFQIEKELREGKLDQVFDRVRETLGKQFGKIVTLEEASQTQAAAEQFQKQVLLLQKGPLGSIVKDDQTAFRVLEAFKAREQGGPVQDLSKDFLQKSMESGNDLAKQTNTYLGQSVRILEQIRDQSGFANLDELQKSVTAASGAGTAVAPTQATKDLRDILSNQMLSSAQSGSTAAAGAAKSLTQGKVTTELDTRDTDISKSISGLTQIPKGAGAAASAIVSNVANYFKDMSKESAEQAEKRYLEDINRRKEEISKSQNFRASDLESLAKEENMIKAGFAKSENRPTTPTGVVGETPSFKVNELETPSSRLAKQAESVANRAAPQTNAADLLVQSRRHEPNRPDENAKLGEITVHVEGYCIRCKSEMEAKSQRHSVNPASRLP